MKMKITAVDKTLVMQNYQDVNWSAMLPLVVCGRISEVFIFYYIYFKTYILKNEAVVIQTLSRCCCRVAQDFSTVLYSFFFK